MYFCRVQSLFLKTFSLWIYYNSCGILHYHSNGLNICLLKLLLTGFEFCLQFVSLNFHYFLRFFFSKKKICYKGKNSKKLNFGINNSNTVGKEQMLDFIRWLLEDAQKLFWFPPNFANLSAQKFLSRYICWMLPPRYSDFLAFFNHILHRMILR